jgi:hypothetical protein
MVGQPGFLVHGFVEQYMDSLVPCRSLVCLTSPSYAPPIFRHVGMGEERADGGEVRKVGQQPRIKASMHRQTNLKQT